ncbi:hypothetical protein NQ176_g3200 [Zarea fungicola]|uniref:Uncharacterized protein n=1 Tax=Zarea fungicola TaxID=93591 RepID=A0ACC1NKT6_9HYPO|nr:hypothetical protein NQ176_g3200 [Lecanicillium fungicola]
MVSFYAPLITLSFALSSLAATCSNGNSGCSVAQFWQAREIACNTRQFGVVDCGNGWTVNAGLQLSVNESQDQAYEHCWDALEDILIQCVNPGGSLGGNWVWSLNGQEDEWLVQAFQQG